MLETRLRVTELEELTLQEAAKESGYGADHLGRLVRDGKIQNAGRRNAPRILRSDLPVKRGRFDISQHSSQYGNASKEQIVRYIVGDGGTR